MPERMSERMSARMSDQMWDRTSERMPDRMPELECQKECQNICQIECQNISMAFLSLHVEKFIYNRDISTSGPSELFAKTLETGNNLQQVTTHYLKWIHAGLICETVNITQSHIDFLLCITAMVTWWIRDIGTLVGAFELSSSRSRARGRTDVIIEEFSRKKLCDQ